MTEEDQYQLVAQLRDEAESHRKFMKSNTDWSHPMTEAITTVAPIIYDKIADIIETLRNP